MKHTIPHIQAALDQRFPGVRLHYNHDVGYWILTDWIYGPHGQRATALFMKTPVLLWPIEDYPYTNRRICGIVSSPDGEPVYPVMDNVLFVMEQSFYGAAEAELQRRLDQLDEGEAQEKAQNREVMREALKETASQAWDRHVGKVWASKSGVTQPRKSRRDLAQKIMDDAWADHAAREHMNEGGVPISVPRSSK